MSEAEMSDYKIGDKIRKLRHTKQVTLQTVALGTGFSPALISQIENNNVSPPITTLARIAKFFDIKMTYFFEDGHEQRFEIVRKNQRSPVYTEETDLALIYALSPRKQQKKMEPFLVSGTGNLVPSDSNSRQNEEFLFVVKGSAELLFEGHRVLLDAGDSIYVDAVLKYQLSAHNKNETVLIRVVGR